MTESNPSHLMADADRERVVARLNTAVGEGRLTLGEFEDRVTGVLAARTYGEIEPYVADLPIVAQQAVAQSTGGAELSARGSSLRRRGRWVVPAEMRIVGLGSSIQLDFTEAVMTSSVVHIDIDLRGSSLRMTVPEGSSVDLGAAALTGSSAKVKRLSEYATPGQLGTHFVITGSLVGSSAKAAPPSRFWARVPLIRMWWGAGRRTR
jgi:hypothetical protein